MIKIIIEHVDKDGNVKRGLLEFPVSLIFLGLPLAIIDEEKLKKILEKIGF